MKSNLIMMTNVIFFSFLPSWRRWFFFILLVLTGCCSSIVWIFLFYFTRKFSSFFSFSIFETTKITRALITINLMMIIKWFLWCYHHHYHYYLTEKKNKNMMNIFEEKKERKTYSENRKTWEKVIRKEWKRN